MKFNYDIIIHFSFVAACDKLNRDNVSVTVFPNNSVKGVIGAHVVLSCKVNGTPSDGIPSWCKISSDNDCTPVNLTSSINRNCSWLNTIDINITNTTIGQYRCVIFDKMASVQVSLLQQVDLENTSKGELTLAYNILLFHFSITHYIGVITSSCYCHTNSYNYNFSLHYTPLVQDY